ncbi:MAG TPA: hypothetical protein VH833_01055 [Gemmatimonadales bacterium]|jgi:hypothetical protein
MPAPVSHPVHSIRALIPIAVSLSLAVAPPKLGAQAAPTPPKLSPALESVRAALDKYADPVVAVRDGYFSTIACVDFPTAGGAGQMQYPAGGMGVHLLNPGAIGPQIDTLRPQVLIYEPVGDKLRLAAAEWFVPVSVSAARPTLWGHPFDGPMEGHEPFMPAALHHWDLHVWLWKENPAGVFTPTNPAVKCPPGSYTFHENAPKMLEHH